MIYPLGVNAPRTGATSRDFAIVRRGYDADEVDGFLQAQAADREEESRAARERIAELEAEVGRIGRLQAELREARYQQEELSRALESSARANDEMLERTNAEITAKMAAVDREVAEQRANMDAEIAQRRNEAQAEASELLVRARTAAEELGQSTRERVEAEARAETQRLRTEAAELEVRCRLLEERVAYLDDLRNSLVTTLKAIASAGIDALKDGPAAAASPSTDATT